MTADGQKAGLVLDQFDDHSVNVNVSGEYEILISYSLADSCQNQFTLPDDLKTWHIPVKVYDPSVYELWTLKVDNSAFYVTSLTKPASDAKLFWLKSENKLTEEELSTQNWEVFPDPDDGTTLNPYLSGFQISRTLLTRGIYHYFQVVSSTQHSTILIIQDNGEEYNYENTGGDRDGSSSDDAPSGSLVQPAPAAPAPGPSTSEGASPGSQDAPILKELEEKMQQAAEEMEFEKAIEYRELLGSVKKIAQKQKITNSDMEDKDVIAMAKDREDAVVQVFFIRDGRLIGRDHFCLHIAADDKKEEILAAFVKQFYAGTPYIPREIMMQYEIGEAEVIESWLSERKGQKVHICVPKKGEKEKLVELAQKNAKMVLDQDKERIRREEGRTIGAMKEIAGLLNLPEISRVEAYDISNISGFQTVGSMVVFEKGKPKRSDYRKFRIRGVQGADDYASMEEMLTRRLSHYETYPDLIMMDGGRGQVNIALKVMDAVGVHVPVCGMVKDDHHRTRGIYFNNVEIPIDRDSEGFRLVTRIQDEAHRFAIEYHRSLRSKEQVHSVLDDIKGIGPARRRALMKAFQTLDDLKAASEEELAQVEGMNSLSARQVYEFFHVAKQN